MSALAIVIVLVLLVLAALGSLAEMAITRIGRVRAHGLAQDDRRGADALLALVEDPGPHRNVLLLVELSSLAAVVGIVGISAADRWGGATAAIAIAIASLLIYVLVQLVPKTIAVQRPEAVALGAARPVGAITRVLGPVTQLFVGLANLSIVVFKGHALPKGPFVTDEEIRQNQEEADEEEEVEEGERELIHSVFEFGDAIVREVMVPRTDMVSMESNAGLEEALKVIVEAGYSRIPIYDGDLDNIVGVLYAKDLMRRMHETNGGGGHVGALGRAPTFVPEQKRLNELLREMQEQHVHMAIVVDEYGGTAGLVTIEDLIEEIVGEIVDEFDREEPLVEPIDDETIRVDAKMSIDEVNDLLEVDLPHEEWDTVGGLVFGLTGRVPVQGEVVRLNGLQFTTERVTGRRIQKVVIRKSAPVE